MVDRFSSVSSLHTIMAPIFLTFDRASDSIYPVYQHSCNTKIRFQSCEQNMFRHKLEIVSKLL